MFYKLRDKERSKESAYVLVAFRFLVRLFVSFVSHIARYAPSSTDKSSSLRNQNQLNLIFRTPLVSEHLFGVKIIKRAVHGLLRKWEEGGNGRRGFAVAC